jgi:hypothetical protein
VTYLDAECKMHMVCKGAREQVQKLKGTSFIFLLVDGINLRSMEYSRQMKRNFGTGKFKSFGPTKCGGLAQNEINLAPETPTSSNHRCAAASIPLSPSLRPDRPAFPNRVLRPSSPQSALPTSSAALPWRPVLPPSSLTLATTRSKGLPAASISNTASPAISAHNKEAVDPPSLRAGRVGRPRPDRPPR